MLSSLCSDLTQLSKYQTSQFPIKFPIKVWVPSDLLQHSKAELPGTQGFKPLKPMTKSKCKECHLFRFLPINERQPPEDTFKQHYHQHPVMLREHRGTRSHRAWDRRRGLVYMRQEPRARVWPSSSPGQGVSLKQAGCFSLSC